MTTPTPPAEQPSTATAENNDARLLQLRTLLLGPEQAQLAALHQRLNNPEDLSKAIAEAIALRAKQDHKLQTTLQPLIEEALRISVARDPSMLATSLFPIIGDAVRKAVAHALQGMFDSLNLMLDRGLSLESWRWRFEAWRTGRSFGEVALTHSLNYRVEQVFLIHRETGLLIGHVSHAGEEGVVQDADLISGMLTAIQDFVRDSFSPRQSEELEVLQVGEFKLWLQHSPLLLLAAVVSGQPPPELRQVLVREIEAIHQEFSSALQHFDGDTTALAGAEPHLRRCLLGAQRAARVKKSYRTVWLAASAIVIILAVLIGLRIRENRRWARYLDDLRAQPGIALISSSRQWLGFTVTGLRDPMAVDPWQLLPAYKLPQDKVLEHWEPYQSLAPAFETARRLAEQKTILEREVIHFDLNSSQLPMSQFAALENVEADWRAIARLAESTGVTPTLNIFGHTDRTGKEEHNVELSQARSQSVAAALLAQGIPAATLRSAGVADQNPGHAGSSAYPQELDRRVTFAVTLTRNAAPHP